MEEADGRGTGARALALPIMQSYTSTAAPPPRRARQRRHLREAQGVPGSYEKRSRRCSVDPAPGIQSNGKAARAQEMKICAVKERGAGRGAYTIRWLGPTLVPAEVPLLSRAIALQAPRRSRRFCHTLSVQAPMRKEAAARMALAVATSAAAVAAVERLGRSRSQPMLQFRALLTG